jgi:hypothetical protein
MGLALRRDLAVEITSREIGDSDRGSPNGKIGGRILAGSYLAQNLSRLSPCFVRSQRIIAPNLQESLWTIPARAGWAISQYESLGSACSTRMQRPGRAPSHFT